MRATFAGRRTTGRHWVCRCSSPPSDTDASPTVPVQGHGGGSYAGAWVVVHSKPERQVEVAQRSLIGPLAKNLLGNVCHLAQCRSEIRHVSLAPVALASSASIWVISAARLRKRDARSRARSSTSARSSSRSRRRRRSASSCSSTSVRELPSASSDWIASSAAMVPSKWSASKRAAQPSV